MKKIKIFLASMLMAAVMLTAGNPVSAAETTEEKGTIEVDMKAGGDLILYKVADVEMKDDGNEQYVLTQAFSGVTGAREMINDKDRLGDKNLPGRFAAVISNAASLETKKAAKDETLSFSNLERGIYLITQNTAADGYYKIDPFLVSVPGPDKTMTVKATPKMALKGIPETTPPPRTPSKPPRIPQTGQLWWPVPVMGVCGILLIVAGFLKRRHSQEF